MKDNFLFRYKQKRVQNKNKQNVLVLFPKKEDGRNERENVRKNNFAIQDEIISSKKSVSLCFHSKWFNWTKSNKKT